jgi:CDP-glycerol glycerophosphotransferase (TagB/SpsB family)
MKKQKGIWLIFERGNEAKDNGYVFFKYLREKHPEIKAFYVADKNCPKDYRRVAKYKNIVQKGSLKHKLYYLFAKKIITTHPGTCDPFPYRSFRGGIRKKLFPRKYIFLQHGITMNDIRHLYGKKAAPVDLFICGAKKEYEYVSNNFGFQKNEVAYTGFARFDLLHKRQEKNYILLMPTWRRGFSTGKYGGCNDRDNFTNSEYYRSYQSLINNITLNQMLMEHNYKLIFYPHYDIQQFIDCFKTDSKQVLIASMKDYDVRQLLKESKLMITDYSSVGMDFAYMEKPIIYYQFDKEQFRSMHYGKGYFSYEEDGFGPVVETEKDVIDVLQNYFNQGMKNSKEYIDKSRAFFVLKDRRNCERIYDKIVRLK